VGGWVGGGGASVYKIFSEHALEMGQLNFLFREEREGGEVGMEVRGVGAAAGAEGEGGGEGAAAGAEGGGGVEEGRGVGGGDTWRVLARRVWQAYPIFSPPESFASFVRLFSFSFSFLFFSISSFLFLFFHFLLLFFLFSRGMWGLRNKIRNLLPFL
jgi:hypothetical protein